MHFDPALSQIIFFQVKLPVYDSCRIFGQLSPVAGDCRGVGGREEAREKICGFQNGIL